MTRVIAICVVWLWLATPALAAVKVVGAEGNRQLDASNFSPKMKSSYELVKVKCSACHSLERIVVAFTTGVALISGQAFDHDVMKAVTFQMNRKANKTNKNVITKEEAKEIAIFLNFLLNESVR